MPNFLQCLINCGMHITPDERVLWLNSLPRIGLKFILDWFHERIYPRPDRLGEGFPMNVHIKLMQSMGELLQDIIKTVLLTTHCTNRRSFTEWKTYLDI